VAAKAAGSLHWQYEIVCGKIIIVDHTWSEVIILLIQQAWVDILSNFNFE